MLVFHLFLLLLFIWFAQAGLGQKKCLGNVPRHFFVWKMIFFLTGTEVFYAAETIDFSRNFENYADLKRAWEKCDCVRGGGMIQ